MTPGEVAALITAVGVLIAAMAGAYATVKSTRTIRATHTMVQQVDAAVNGKAPGESTMVSQVQDLHDAIPPEEAVLPTLRRIEARLEALESPPTEG